jgi:hypothetical protein
MTLTRFAALCYPLSVIKSLLQNSRRARSLFTAVLVAYILLFSAFALFHAYSENELSDSHECAIGMSVSHGQALLPILIALTLFLIPLTGAPILRFFFPVDLFSLQKAIRGPPQQFSF